MDGADKEKLEAYLQDKSLDELWEGLLLAVEYIRSSEEKAAD